MDPVGWEEEIEAVHLEILQEKINNYIHFLESKQYVERYYLLNQFQAIDFETLETISLKPEIKQELRQFMDQLYEEYVGIHLKSKKFIDSLADWGQLLKEEKK